MSRRLGRVTTSFALLSISFGSGARADIGSAGTSDNSTGTLEARASQSLTGGRRASAASSSAPRCTWEKFTDLQMAVDLSGGAPSPVVRDSASGSILPVGSPSSQTTETLYKKVCAGVDGYTLSWIPDVVDVQALVSSAQDRVTAQVPTPALNMNPEPSHGGIVNIGLWLAVADPGEVSVTASVGPVWATVTARYESTTWEFGNGDSLTCPGLGTPIVDLETADAGPCGYTYRWPSAPKFTGTDDLAYHASATGHWVITYTTSTGAGGTLPPIDRTTEFLYQVREIQTVRVADNG